MRVTDKEIIRAAKNVKQGKAGTWDCIPSALFKIKA